MTTVRNIQSVTISLSACLIFPLAFLLITFSNPTGLIYVSASLNIYLFYINIPPGHFKIQFLYMRLVFQIVSLFLFLLYSIASSVSFYHNFSSSCPLSYLPLCCCCSHLSPHLPLTFFPLLSTLSVSSLPHACKMYCNQHCFYSKLILYNNKLPFYMLQMPVENLVSPESQFMSRLQ